MKTIVRYKIGENKLRTDICSDTTACFVPTIATAPSVRPAGAAPNVATGLIYNIQR